MKKVFFSAIALLAFSATSFASAIDEKDDLQSTVNENSLYLPCTDAWVADVANLQDNWGATYEEATLLADRCFEECLDYTYGPSN
jgi:hypothetical protein